MREILFRAKRIDNKEWVEGFYVNTYYPDGDQHTTGHFIVKYPGAPHEIYTETLCQYTGLTDKNGKKIFEGDILQLTDKTNGGECVAVVKFGNPNGKYDWGFQLDKIIGDDLNMDILLWIDMEDSGAYAEVIGNMFDAPLLMEGE